MLFLDAKCGAQALLPLIRLIKYGVIPLIEIGIPIILIVLGMLDLGKAVVAAKEDEIKSAQKLLIKRVIYALAIFFVVLIVQVIFGLVAKSGDADATKNSMDWLTCWNEA